VSRNEAGQASPHPKTAELLERLHLWARPLLADAEFRAFNRRRLRRALDFHDDELRDDAKDFPIPTAWEPEYAGVMAFYFLNAECERLQSLHLYFLRYPFKPGEMSKRQHLQNVFDLFFAGFYVVQQRLETYLNAVKPLLDVPPDVGRLLKRYKRDFDPELRPRHQATHDRPYDDIVLDRLWMADVMGQDEAQRAVWRNEERALYRRETRRWADLAHRRASLVLDYLEAVATLTLASGAFLQPPSWEGRGQPDLTQGRR
jgi:hypothetical protein